jgi:hypothetical protein
MLCRSLLLQMPLGYSNTSPQHHGEVPAHRWRSDEKSLASQVLPSLSTLLQSQGSLAVREHKSYIAGLVAATAVVTEALKSLVSQHPPCEDYC